MRPENLKSDFIRKKGMRVVLFTTTNVCKMLLECATRTKQDVSGRLWILGLKNKNSQLWKIPSVAEVNRYMFQTSWLRITIEKVSAGNLKLDD